MYCQSCTETWINLHYLEPLHGFRWEKEENVLHESFSICVIMRGNLQSAEDMIQELLVQVGGDQLQKVRV